MAKLVECQNVRLNNQIHQIDQRYLIQLLLNCCKKPDNYIVLKFYIQNQTSVR